MSPIINFISYIPMPSEYRKKRLLVIDDDALMRDLIGTIARMHGFDCQGVGEQEAARRIIEAQPPEVLILDLWMPDRDGIEWIGELARHRSTARLILCSGYDRRVLESAAILAASLGLDVLGILEKPFHATDLVRLLNKDSSAPGCHPPSPAIGVEEIHAAIVENRLAVYFQPQVRLGDGRWIGMEALVRWNHPEHGWIPPSLFVGLAESSGLGLELTRKVLELALVGYSRIVEETGFEGYLSVNLPGTALVDHGFPEQVFAQVGSSGCCPGNLVFELTETAMARDADIAMEILARLRLKGFSLSIDDFGTGYSSFELLRKFPFNELKVEMEFVRAAKIDSVARAIVENSVALARQLGIASVAEGVETQADWNWLKALGCERAQGYFVGRAVPAEVLIPWSRSWRSARNGNQGSEPAARARWPGLAG